MTSRPLVHARAQPGAGRNRRAGVVFCLLSLASSGCGGGPGASARPREPAASGPAARVQDVPAPAEAVVPAPRTDGDVLLADVVEVHDKLAAGAPLLVLDARGRGDYEQEHVPGAVSVPLPKIAAAGNLPGVPRDYEIVVYCSSEACPVSRTAVRALTGFGYTNVKDMRAGLVGWKQAGFATARGKERSGGT